MGEHKENNTNYFNRVHLLYNLATIDSEKKGIPFNPENYRWELGANVMASVADKLKEYSDSTAHTTLFGIIVNFKPYDKEALKLWQNVTDRLYEGKAGT